MAKEVYKISGNDAANYEERLGPLVFEPAAQELLSHLVSIPARSILEIACGTGRLTKNLRAFFPATTSITATDINPDMLDLAREKLEGLPIHLQLADARQLPFADQAFDMVVNQFGLMFLPDKQGGVNEAYRVLRSGGHFVFTTWDSMSNMALFRLLIGETILPLFDGEDTSRFHTPFALHDPEQLNTYMKQAGFAHYKAILVTFTGQADSAKQIVDSYFRYHPLGREVKEKAPASFDHTALLLEQKLTQQFGPAPFAFELSAYVGIGQK